METHTSRCACVFMHVLLDYTDLEKEV
jgi:hypothetical protein